MKWEVIILLAVAILVASEEFLPRVNDISYLSLYAGDGKELFWVLQTSVLAFVGTTFKCELLFAFGKLLLQ